MALERRHPAAWVGPRRAALFLVALAALLPGCKEEEGLRRSESTPPEAAEVRPPAGPAKERILGAIVPVGGQDGGWWFFKLKGPAEAVAAQRADFDRFIASVRFTDDAKKPFAWTLPEGWKEQPADPKLPGGIATLAIEGKVPLQLTVSRAGGTLLMNVNRWRGQVGLGPVSPVELDKVAEYRTVAGRTFVCVDLAGPGGDGKSMIPPFAKGH